MFVWYLYDNFSPEWAAVRTNFKCKTICEFMQQRLVFPGFIQMWVAQEKWLFLNIVKYSWSSKHNEKWRLFRFSALLFFSSPINFKQIEGRFHRGLVAYWTRKTTTKKLPTNLRACFIQCNLFSSHKHRSWVESEREWEGRAREAKKLHLTVSLSVKLSGSQMVLL